MKNTVRKNTEISFGNLLSGKKEEQTPQQTDPTGGRKAARAAELSAQRSAAKASQSSAAKQTEQPAQSTQSTQTAQSTQSAKPAQTVQTAQDTANTPTAQTPQTAVQPAVRQSAPPPAAASLPRADVTALEKQAQAVYSAETGAANARYNAATEAAVLRLRQAELDAEGQYNDERERIAIETARSLDNAALYAAARGDRGGIGQSQYNSIQASAGEATARVNAEQRAFAQSTALNIAQLRAQGEYERADAMLASAQSQLARLGEISKWAQQYNLDAAELADEMDKWRVEAQSELYSIDAGNALKYAQLAAKGTSSSSSKSSKSSSGGGEEEDILSGTIPGQTRTDRMFELMRLSGAPYTWLTENAEACGIKSPTQKTLEKIMNEYEKWLKS